MGYSLSDVNYVMAFARAIKSFPGLDKYKNDVQQIKDNEGYFEEKFAQCFNSIEKMSTASGNNLDIVNPIMEGYAELKENLEDIHQFTKRLLADKELMDREPFLKAYVGSIKFMLDRGLSDEANSHDYMGEDAFNITAFLWDQFEKLPTGAEYAAMEEPNKSTADKILEFMNANKDYYEFFDIVDKAVMENPGKVAEDKVYAQLDNNTIRLKTAAEGMANTSKADIIKFFKDTGNTKWLERLAGDLYDNEKHGPDKIPQQLEHRRLQLGNNLNPREAVLLESVSAQVKIMFKDAQGAGAEWENLPEGYRNLAITAKAMADECTKRAKEGFKSIRDKEEFFREMGERASKFNKEINDIKDPTNLNADESRAMANYARPLFMLGHAQCGCFNLLAKEGEKFNLREVAQSPDFKEQFKEFYNMMKNTGSGYAFHKNSKEYTNLMNTAKVVAELCDKESLNEVQKKALGDCYSKLSKVCQEYLTDRKITVKNTEVGEDRFAGALGILNLVDPANGERVRNAAETIRRKAVSFDSIKERAHTKGEAKAAKDAGKKAPAKKAPEKNAPLGRRI